MRAAKRLPRFCFAFLLVLASVSSAFAAPITRADVFKTLKVDEISADYVVLVDTSGSMKGRWPTVKKNVATFLAAMAPADHLSLVTFDSAPAIRYSGAVSSSGLAAAQLPKTPTGAKTDLGAAIEYGLRELSRPDASPVQTILLITDGKHDAPGGSSYPRTTGAAWTRLRETAAKALNGRTIRAYALGLGGNTDAAVLKTVYPDAAIVALPDSQLPGYLERVKEETRIAKAQQVLGADLNGVVKATWSVPTLDLNKGRGEAKLTLVSTAKYVPLAVSGLKASISGLAGTAAGLPDSVTLAPGESQTYAVKLTWLPPQEMRIGTRQVERAGKIALVGQTTSPWTDVLNRDLGLQFAPKLASEGGSFRAKGTIGFSAVTFALLVALIVGAAALVWALFQATRPSLGQGGGTLLITGESGRHEVRLQGKRMRIGPGKPIDLPGSGFVTGKRRKRSGGPGKELLVQVKYKGTDGKPQAASLAGGDDKTLSGVRFKYQTEMNSRRR